MQRFDNSTNQDTTIPDLLSFIFNNPKKSAEKAAQLAYEFSPLYAITAAQNARENLRQDNDALAAIDTVEGILSMIPVAGRVVSKPLGKAAREVVSASGDVVVGDVVTFRQDVFGGSFKNPKKIGERIIKGEVVKDSYGADKQQHTFTIRPIEVSGDNASEIMDKETFRIKGRNLYRYGVDREKWADENARKIVADEKHQRGDKARLERNIRKEGSPSQTIQQNQEILRPVGQKVTHPKFGDGEVISHDKAEGSSIINVKFNDGKIIPIENNYVSNLAEKTYDYTDAERKSGAALSKNKLRVPLEDMEAKINPTNETLLPRTILDPEALLGSKLIPAVGDRTARSGQLVKVNDTELAYPVNLEGGVDYMRGLPQQVDRSSWGSDRGVISRLYNLAEDIGKDSDVNLVYSAMGARSGDFSTMTADALYSQILNSKITKKAKKEFDSDFKKLIPDWKGLDHKDAREFLIKNPVARKAFSETVALGKYQDLNFPDIASTRAAISMPELLNQQTGVSGYGISKLDTTGGYNPNPTIPHSSYDTALKGTYRGGLLNHIPREVMFPDFYKERRKLNLPKGSDDRAFGMKKLYQDANEEWLEGILKYLDKS